MERVHFIGIGGSGLSAIARVLLERGTPVSGSDRQQNLLTAELAALGARIFTGHEPDQVAGADIVVRSSAIPDQNPEVLAARASGIPVLKRSEFLPTLLAENDVIAVAGTHGKTTTTAMIAWALKALGEDPSYIIGSTAYNLGNNAHAGSGRLFVIEADEYDYMFLGTSPLVAVVTMIEHDHPDCFPTPESFYAAFRQFAHQIKPSGALIACADDPQAYTLLSEMAHSGLTLITYSLDKTNSYHTQNIQAVPQAGYSFQAYRSDMPLADLSLQVPGKYNVLNALATLAVIDYLHLSVNRAAGALSTFRGTARRFEVIGTTNEITIIDDYAHHPTEIRVTLEAARKRYPGHRIWAVWQPHTYSRTRQLFFEFARAFSDADQVLITPIFAARESPPTDGFSGLDVVNAMSHPAARYIPNLHETGDYLVRNLIPGDIVLVLSAGDADQISKWVLEALNKPEKETHV
jgi:UDP-N-acetylmuramate--alanine ligase